MRSSQTASAALVAISMALLVAACGAPKSGSGPGPTCSSKGPSVEVVAELQNHHVVDRCVGFSGRQIQGEVAMHRSGIEFALQHFSFGDAVCQIANEPKSYSNCFGTGQPYWALFLWSGKGKWRASSTGISEVVLKPGQALGWRYDPSQGTALAPPLPPKS